MAHSIAKPTIEDCERILCILLQWTEKEEAEKYVKRIINEINGNTEFGMSFWVIKKNDEVVGVGGISGILPSVKKFSKSDNPGELKILYLDNLFRGQGLGGIFINFLEEKAKENNYTELIIRSAEIYKDTAYEFYKKMGFKSVGLTENNMTVFSKEL